MNRLLIIIVYANAFFVAVPIGIMAFLLSALESPLQNIMIIGWNFQQLLCIVGYIAIVVYLVRDAHREITTWKTDNKK
jgi:hypothetical protein